MLVGLDIPKTLGSSFFKLGSDRGCNLLSQGTRDLVTPATRAFQGDGEAGKEEACRTWREAADAFWNKTVSDSAAAATSRVKQLHRTPSIRMVVRVSELIVH